MYQGNRRRAVTPIWQPDMLIRVPGGACFHRLLPTHHADINGGESLDLITL